MGSSYYRGCWHEVSKPLFIGYYHLRLSPIKAVYVPKDFFLHAASLDQAFAHCRRFSTAATRRCMAHVAVPLVGVALSRPLAVIALVGFYPANKLIARRLFPQRLSPLLSRDHWVLVRLSADYSHLWGRYLRITTTSATTERHCWRSAVRLACLIHAASVHPELGSNSLNKFTSKRRIE